MLNYLFIPFLGGTGSRAAFKFRLRLHTKKAGSRSDPQHCFLHVDMEDVYSEVYSVYCMPFNLHCVHCTVLYRVLYIVLYCTLYIVLYCTVYIVLYCAVYIICSSSSMGSMFCLITDELKIITKKLPIN